MPEPIRVVFRWCLVEHAGLRRKAKMCRQLWGSGPLTLYHMTQTAPIFFRDVRYALFDEMNLAISRLTDSPTTGKKNNLCLERLIDLVEADKPQPFSLISELRDHVEAARSEAGNIRKKRNTIIAHNDYDTLTSGDEVFLTAGQKTLDVILGNFDQILNRVQSSYGGMEYPLDLLELGSDADRLARHLENSEKAISDLARLKWEGPPKGTC